ncbi:hypothetical protein MTX26_05720 [Bradyrhizobium sp. ISRA443]|uniref:hypothetical protein n=1 Tax=unclassified Bradyrhizobium TaxID=2631580 RepID=UPI0024789F5B|nr:MULTISPECIES: hypothetical protein [unclassified Bradyrhizobium]WGR95352.1 hypothetical protein MTX20_15910 [Bradyrhizobium sp. ISRA435]WGS00348.1 hypothetical protein MTX23_05720 [Bradyrhizobium sp. ISRA436]WGS07237.1 hypothetical protein MTX18_05720 [Bradyrhizobium sp. ISRA437]WGS14122.1 hypothetical protein MTX26_05720 [Bradyrhizobium sp. ISRA443]
MTIFRCHRPRQRTIKIPETLAILRPGRGVLDTPHRWGRHGYSLKPPQRDDTETAKTQSTIRKSVKRSSAEIMLKHNAKAR